ncbi:MAG: leucyl aminopeptidase [Pelagibacteraceae bacterium]|nr:MAG: leucyl aminopeptidase [Pelagibacteraceae bacterium]
MLDLKIIPNVNNNSDFYIFFCEKNFLFNSKKLSFIDINNKEICSILTKNKDEDYFVFNYHSLRPKKIIFINQKDNKDEFEYQNIGGKVISEIKLAKEINVIFSNENKSLENFYFNFLLGCFLKKYSFLKYKTIYKKNENKKKKIDFLITSSNKNFFIKIKKDIENIINGVFLTRDLVSEPPNYLNPEKFVNEIKKLSRLGLKVDVFDYSKMKKIGMNALLGVAQGSKNLPYFVTITWKPNNSKNKKPLSFIGKGVCFDTGGISLKPAKFMEDMKYDMAGAGAVVGLMKTLALRKSKSYIVGAVALVENMPGGSAQRPGDIVKSYSGKTIEVLNTDAEGRLILADAIYYIDEQYKPELIVDLATLTGAIVVSLGNEYAGLFSNNDKLSEKLIKAGEIENEKLWRFPLHKNYDKLMDSKIADIQNINYSGGAGSITAAHFLQRFLKNNTPWAHLDIAGMAWTKKDLDIVPTGATGFGVKLLNKFVEKYYE